jgi:hypothetical protein
MDGKKGGWSPTLRLAVGSLGASLVGCGINLALRKRRYVAVATGIVGLGVLARSVANLGVRDRMNLTATRLRERRHLAAQRPDPADELPREGELRQVH